MTHGARIGYFWWSDETDLDPYLLRFAQMVAAHEREACAKLCDEREGATAIRARNT
jgi:hypothetical protein